MSTEEKKPKTKYDQKIEEVKKILIKEKQEATEKLTSDNIKNLTYNEILELNEKSKIGTVTNRRYERYMVDHNPLEDPDVSR